MKNTNETLLKRIRESEKQGPFNLEIKGSVMLNYYALGKFIPLLKRWEREQENLDSPQDLAIYLEKNFLGKNLSQCHIERGGYLFEFVSERKGLIGGLILKLRNVPHPDSTFARSNFPPTHIWLKIKPYI